MEIFYLPILVCEKLLFIVHQTFQGLDFCSKPLFQALEGRFLGANDRFFISNLGFQGRDLCIGTLGESIEKFPKARVPELVKILSEEITDENMKIGFRKRIGEKS